MQPAKEITWKTDAVRDLMPAYADIPREFHNQYNPYAKLQAEWFFKGLDAKKIKEKPGIDRKLALRHLGAIQSDWGPKHEHKAAAVAYLMSLWFDIV